MTDRRIRELRSIAPGWSIQIIGSNRAKLTHPRVSGCVISGLSPPDPRTRRNLIADLKRRLRDAKAM